jgi:AraC-like DNA-binding protein
MMVDDFRAMIQGSVRFEWYHGGSAPVTSHDTGWISAPGFGIIQVIAMRTVVELVGGVRHVIEPGSALVVDANVSCALSSTALGQAISRFGHGNFFVFGGTSVLSLFDVPPVVALPTSMLLGDLCVELHQLHATADALDPIRFATRKLTLGMRLLDAIIGPLVPNEQAMVLLAHAQRLAPVLTYIDEHLARRTTRATLARQAGLSSSQFHALFLAVMRKSPMAYLAERRMRHARQLLITTTRSVQEIASAVGYEDPFHFSRAFKISSGTSPRIFRTRNHWLIGG